MYLFSKVFKIICFKVHELSKENFIFISCDRDFFACLDFAKVADIICPVLSCKDCQIDGLVKDPHSNAKAFDEAGYKLLTALRIQGIPKMMGIIQDLESIPTAKQSLVKFVFEKVLYLKKVRKFYQRYFTSELTTDDKNISFEPNEQGVRTLIRNLQTLTPNTIDWREKKGYMIVDKLIFHAVCSFPNLFIKNILEFKSNRIIWVLKGLRN